MKLKAQDTFFKRKKIIKSTFMYVLDLNAVSLKIVLCLVLFPFEECLE